MTMDEMERLRILARNAREVGGSCEHRTTVDCECCDGWDERCLDCGKVHL